MLVDRAIFDLVHLVQLGLEGQEILALLGIQIDKLLLELFERVGDLEEVLVAQEEIIVALLGLLGDLLCRNHQGILLKELSHAFLTVGLVFEVGTVGGGGDRL